MLRSLERNGDALTYALKRILRGHRGHPYDHGRVCHNESVCRRDYRLASRTNEPNLLTMKRLEVRSGSAKSGSKAAEVQASP